MQKTLLIVLSAFCRLASADTAAKPIYDQWYAVAGKSGVVSAYQERLEDRGGKLFFQVRSWRKEGDQITEESVGGLATGDESLTPQFFNLHSASGGNETTVDASFQGRVLIAKVSTGGKAKAPIRKQVPAGAILSNFFPVLIKSKLATLKPGKAVAFAALLEDGHAQGFPVLNGSLKLESPDEFAKQNKAAKLSVKFAGMSNTWWVDDKGSAIKIDIPAAGLRVERATQAQADEFLKAIGIQK